MELIEKRDAYNIIKDMIGLARRDVLMNAYNALKNLPTIDAVPVVHGEWVGVSPMTDTRECSICGYNIISDELETPYCPLCGARMDEKERSR